MFPDRQEHAAVTTMDRGFPAAFVAFSLKQRLSFSQEDSVNLRWSFCCGGSGNDSTGSVL